MALTMLTTGRAGLAAAALAALLLLTGCPSEATPAPPVETQQAPNGSDDDQADDEGQGSDDDQADDEGDDQADDEGDDQGDG